MLVYGGQLVFISTHSFLNPRDRTRVSPLRGSRGVDELQVYVYVVPRPSPTLAGNESPITASSGLAGTQTQD